MATAFSLAENDAGADAWSRIFDSSVRVLVDSSGPMLKHEEADLLLAGAPFGHAVSGAPDRLIGQLPPLLAELGYGIASIAERFAALMGCDTVRLRLEGIVGNACRRVHADYTDLRLICTLAGQGTQYTLGDDPDGPLQQIPTGTVALFKGLEFGSGHAACLHRSPPIEGTGVRRLVLVIDTPRKEAGVLRFEPLVSAATAC